MNQGRHRIVFNARRGQLMAVAETAHAQGKAGGDGCGAAVSRSAALPRHLALAISISLFGFYGVLPDAKAQIVAYRNAPGSQQATILSTGNGVPLVNIQTPSAAGVSRNTYGQFDVDEKGAILNNSRKGAQTQLGGQVSGNPWMARGTARVILNEVVSSNPSRLRGYVEVGGDKAEVVVANPSGVEVDGGGFINASRATVTTGKPTVSNGNLDGYEVRQGTVTVKSRGMDASQTDYTAVIARAVQVNGAIRARELKLIAGANRVSADHSQVTPIAGTGPAPAYALDVSELGGMYAGKITLVGTEAGVGVRNAGKIVASAGEVVITVDGRLINTGQILSDADANLNVGGLGNRGTVYGRRTVRVATAGNIDNTGLIGAQDNVLLDASGEASRIDSTTASSLIAGLMADGTLGSLGDLTLTATAGIRASGRNRAAGTLEATSPSISIWGSNTSAPIVFLEAIPNSRRSRTRRDLRLSSLLEGDVGSIDAGSATVVADTRLTAHTDGLLSTDGARIVAASIDLEAHDLSNRGGQIIHTGANGLTLDFPGRIDNTGGGIASNSAIGITVTGLLNDRGNIETNASLRVDASGHVANGSGRIVGGGGTQVEAGSLDSSGLIAGSVTTRSSLNNSGTISGLATAGSDLGNSGRIGGSATAGNALTNTGDIGGYAQAGSTLTNSGTIGGSAQAGTALDNAGSIRDFAVAGSTLTNSGTIAHDAQAGSDLTNSGKIGGDATAKGSLTNAGTGTVTGYAAAGTTLANAGSIGRFAVAGTTLTNSGTVVGSAEAGTDLTNSGKIGGDATAKGSLTNAVTGTVTGYAAAGTTLANAGSIGKFAVAGTTLTNSGTVAGSAEAGTDLTNSGKIGGDATAKGGLTNAGTGTITGYASAATALDNSGSIGKFALAGTTLTNSGTIAESASAGSNLANSGRIGGSADAGGSLGNSGSIGGSAGAGADLGNSGSIGGSASAGTGLDNSGTIGGSAGAGGGLGNTGSIGGSAGAGAGLSNSGSIGGSASAGAGLTNSGTIGGSASAATSLGNTGTIGGSASAATDITNSGSIGSHGGTIGVNAAHVTNTGTIGTGGATVTVVADSLDNSHGTVTGASVNVGATVVTNIEGDLHASHNLTIASRNTLDNTHGRIDAGGLLAIYDPATAGNTTARNAAAQDAATRTLSIVNTNGSLTAGTNLVLDAASVSQDGRVASLGDFSASLNGDYTRTAATQDPFQVAGRISLSFTGTVTNDSVWHADHGLSVTGSQVLNNGEISSNGITSVQATAGALTNHGLIQGDTVVTLGIDLDNQGGRIVGNSYYANFTGSANNTHGSINIAGAAEIHVAGDLVNDAGRIDAGSLALQVSGNTYNRTLPGTEIQTGGYRWTAGSLVRNTQTQADTRAGITARSGDLDMEVGGNLSMQGADLTATGKLTGFVLGDVAATSLALQGSRSTGSVFGLNNYGTESTTSHILSDIHAGSDLSLIAGGNAGYEGTDIHAGSDLTLGAVTGDLNVDAALNSSSGHSTQSSGSSYAWGEGDSASSTTTTVDTNAQVAVGGSLAAGNDLHLLAGHDLHLTGIDAAAATGRLQVIAGHNIDAGSLAAVSTAASTTRTTGPADEGNPFASGTSTTTTTATTQAGGNFTARTGILMDAGHGNPFSTEFVAATREARVAAGLPAVAAAVTDTNGHLHVTGANLTSGSETQRTDITLAAAGDVSIGSAWNSTSTANGSTGTVSPWATLLPGSAAAGPTLTLANVSGHLAGNRIAIGSEHGSVELAGLAVAANGDLVTSSHGNTTLDSSTLTAGHDLDIHADDHLIVRGLVQDPSQTPAMADTLAAGHTPTSAATALTAGHDMNLVGVNGIDAAGIDIRGHAITVTTLGDLHIADGSLHEEHGGWSSQSIRDTARPSTIEGDTLTLSALGSHSDIALTGIAIHTSGQTTLAATGDITVDPGQSYRYDHSTESHSSGFIFQKTSTSDHVRESTLVVPSSIRAGKVDLQALGNITLTATQLESTADKTSVRANGDIQYLAAHNQIVVHDETRTTKSLFGIVPVKKSTTTHTATDRVALVTDVQSETDVLSHSDGSTTLEGTHIVAKGGVTLEARQNLDIRPADESTYTVDTYQVSGLGSAKGSGTYSSRYERHGIDTRETHTVVGSLVSGDTVTATAGGNLTVTGSDVVGTHDVVLAAQGKLTVDAAVNTQTQHSDHRESESGTFSDRGLAVTLGSRHKNETDDATETYHTGSTVGSVQGNVNLYGREGYSQTGSNILAPGGSIFITAPQVDIQAATDTTWNHQTYQTGQGGVTVAITNPIITAIESIRQTHEASHGTSDPRMQALAAATTAMNAYGAYNGLLDQAGNVDPSQAMSIGISISLGSSHSQSDSTQEGHSAAGSTVVAGGDIQIEATGSPTATSGNIRITGTDISAGHDGKLQATGAIDLEAAENGYDQHSTNKSSAASVGIAFTIGDQNGFSINVSASQARGNADGEDIGYTNTHVGAGNTLTLISGGDTILSGATATGRKIVADIGGDLTIESRQDRSTYTSRQESAGFGISLCIPPICYGASSVSASASNAHVNADYASVTEQSGLKAGDGGFQVRVRDHTQLTGGVITSSRTAVDAGINTFSTGTLAMSDIQNHDHYQASAWSFSASASGIVGDQSSPEAQSHMNADQKRAAATPTGPGMSAGTGHVEGEQGSITLSGISNGTLTITNAAGQQASGHNIADTLASLNRNVLTGDDSSHGLTRHWDGARLQEEVQARAAITAAFGQAAPRAVAAFSNRQAADLINQAEHADPENRQALIDEADRWREGGAYRTILHAITGGMSGGVNGALGAGVVAAAAPALTHLQDEVEASLKDAGADPGISRMAGQIFGMGASATIGAAVGGNVGAAVAANVDTNNRQLHPSETKRIKELAGGDSEKEARLTAAACALAHCADGVPLNDPTYPYLKAMQDAGQSMADERTLLAGQRGWQGRNFQSLFGYSWVDQYVIDPATQTRFGIRLEGAVQATASVVALAGDGLACSTGIGCTAAAVTGTVLADNLVAGLDKAVNGQPAVTYGEQVLRSLGMSPEAAAYTYAAIGIAPGVAGAVWTRGPRAATVATEEELGGAGAKGGAGNPAGRLIYDAESQSWTSPGGLVYDQGSDHGNRVLHVLDHTVPNPSKPVHSVFNVERDQVIGLVDEAWAARVGPGTLQANGNRVWVVDMGRQVGTDGQTSIQIVVRGGTTQVITAFPK